MKTNKKSKLLYLGVGIAFLLVLCGFILAAVFGTPTTPSDTADTPNYDGKIAAMGQRFSEGEGVKAVMVDDPARGETLYFDETGAVRKFTKNGDAVRVTGDENTKVLAKDFCRAVSDTAPTGDAATNEDFTFDESCFKVFFATGDGVFLTKPAEGNALLTLYREVLSKLEGTN